jgi:hypothetical protein
MFGSVKRRATGCVRLDAKVLLQNAQEPRISDRLRSGKRLRKCDTAREQFVEHGRPLESHIDTDGSVARDCVGELSNADSQGDRIAWRIPTIRPKGAYKKR